MGDGEALAERGVGGAQLGELARLQFLVGACGRGAAPRRGAGWQIIVAAVAESLAGDIALFGERPLHVIVALCLVGRELGLDHRALVVGPGLGERQLHVAHRVDLLRDTSAWRARTLSWRSELDSSASIWPLRTMVPSSTMIFSTRPPSTASRKTVSSGVTRARSGRKSSNWPLSTVETVDPVGRHRLAVRPRREIIEEEDQQQRARRRRRRSSPGSGSPARSTTRSMPLPLSARPAPSFDFILITLISPLAEPVQQSSCQSRQSGAGRQPPRFVRYRTEAVRRRTSGSAAVTAAAAAAGGARVPPGPARAPPSASRSPARARADSLRSIRTCAFCFPSRGNHAHSPPASAVPDAEKRGFPPFSEQCRRCLSAAGQHPVRKRTPWHDYCLSLRARAVGAETWFGRVSHSAGRSSSTTIRTFSCRRGCCCANCSTRSTTFQSPEEALAAIGGDAPDVILLDANFGRGATNAAEGFQWLGEILKRDPQAVVVMITAHGGVGIAVEAMKRGATDFVSKPWSNERLLATVRTAASLRAVARRRRRPSGSGPSPSPRRRGRRDAVARRVGGDAPSLFADRARRADRGQRPHPRRERHRQGAGRARDPSPLAPRRAA